MSTLTLSYSLHTADSALKLKELPADSVDLTVTSPPYDGLRTYGVVPSETYATLKDNKLQRDRPAKREFTFQFDFETIARELYRVTKPGGVVVWVVMDQTKNGSESGTSFRQALFFKDVCGFNLYDTMIYSSEKPPLTHRRYAQTFEYMFVLTKGVPTTFNPFMDPCKWAGQRCTRTFRQTAEGILKPGNTDTVVKDTKIRGNIWTYVTGRSKGGDGLSFKHPASFPEKLAEDHILSWSNVGDTVLDPFLGSGTTGKTALKNGRNFIGIDCSAEYVEIARQRCELGGAMWVNF